MKREIEILKDLTNKDQSELLELGWLQDDDGYIFSVITFETKDYEPGFIIWVKKGWGKTLTQAKDFLNLKWAGTVLVTK